MKLFFVLAEDEIFADAEEGDEQVESSGTDGPVIQLRSTNTGSGLSNNIMSYSQPIQFISHNT